MNLKPLLALKKEVPWVMPSLRWYLTGGWPRFSKRANQQSEVLSNILLVPGFLEGSNISRIGHDILESLGFRVFVPDLHRFGLLNFGDIIGYSQRVADKLEALIQKWGKFHLVGYSKGGLTCLRLLPKFHKEIDKVFLISTPVQGCDLCDMLWPFMPLPCIKQMRTDSEFLRETLAGLTLEMRRKIIIFACQKDGVVWSRRTWLDNATVLQINATHLEAYINEGIFTQIALLAYGSP